MARVLQEHGAAVEFDERNFGHWWWDTERPNDGGVMHDELMRNWTLRVARRPAGASAALGDGTKPTTIASSSPEYLGRHGVRVLLRRTPAARAFVRVAMADGELRLRTTNVVRLALGGAAARAVSQAHGRLLIDGASVLVDPEACAAEADTPPVEICRQPAGWGVCALPAQRPPELLGPIRRVFAAPWLVVLPDDASEQEVRSHALATGHCARDEHWSLRTRHSCAHGARRVSCA
jgi:hypothetical protein